MKFKIMVITVVAITSGILFYISLPWILTSLGVPPIPKNKHGEFPFHLVYEINGIRHIIDDKIVCEYSGIGIDEGNGIHLRWEASFANGNNLTEFLLTDDSQYGIKLFDGFVQNQGGTSIIFDLGNPQYYLGYKKYTDYSPGRVSILSPSVNGIISEEELWNKYKIKIIDKKFSDPMIGNEISISPPYRDTARLAVKGATLIPQESSYPTGTKQIVFILNNDTDKQLSCEESFYIQKKVEDGKWQDVYREKAVGFSQDKIIIDPHSQISHTYDISKYTNDIPFGEYRVITPVLVPMKKNTYELHVLVGEFKIS